jgi:4'-phosphopantetheinyl transferase EntD
MPDGSGLVAALRGALPAGIAVAVEDPRAGSFGLLPGEVLDNAVPKRLAEFAAGRRAARAAMASLGVPASAIPHGADRAPQWPQGVVGSISHTDGLCLAMVGRSGDWVGLGLDVEADHDLEPTLWPEILRPEDLARINALPDAVQGSGALAVFVAKEAAYKAQYPIGRTLIDFHALTVEIDANRFSATFMQDVQGFAKGTAIDGQFCRADNHIAAFCAIRRPLVV